MSRSSNAASAASRLDGAVDAFRRGDPVCIHDADDREGETDILYPAEAVDHTDLARLRNDGGGLVFVAIPDGVADAFDLPYLHDLIDHPAADFDGLGYDVRPSFSLTVNHRDTYTGITDEDRALTTRSLAEAAADPEVFDFAETFRSPGHVHVLRGAPGLLADRRGHTELGLALAQAADLSRAVVGCEMLDDETGRALDPESAATYAETHGIPFLEGESIVERFG